MSVGATGHHSPFVWVVVGLLMATAACGEARTSTDHAIAERLTDASPVVDPRTAAGTDPALSPDLRALLQEIRDKDTGALAISEEDGRFLRVLVAASGTRRALEIGGASGYSAIWMGLALRETGGTLVTIEYDAQRAQELAANIRRAGLGEIVTVVAGDAFEQIPKLSGSFDFVFLDAWKRDYKKFFDLMYPRLEPGGLFVGHNVVNKRDEMGDFLDTIQHHPSLLTTIVSPSGEGMSLSYRRPATAGTR